MFLGEPPRSQYDLYLRLFGIPLRIHPLFWGVTLLLGIGGRDTPPVQFITWMIAVTVSIIVHELGHAFTQRHFGGRPRIVLYSLGGLAICEDCDRSTRSQILISLAGPFAGFAFAFAILVLLRLLGFGFGVTVGDASFVSGPVPDVGISLLGAGLYWQRLPTEAANMLLLNFLWINILWGIVNLLPIYPLDGGQISRELCQIGNPRGGIVLSLQISTVAAIAMALFGLIAWHSFYTALMFGFLAWSSYQTLQAYRQQLW